MLEIVRKSQRKAKTNANKSSIRIHYDPISNPDAPRTSCKKLVQQIQLHSQMNENIPRRVHFQALKQNENFNLTKC